MSCDKLGAIRGPFHHIFQVHTKPTLAPGLIPRWQFLQESRQMIYFPTGHFGREAVIKQWIGCHFLQPQAMLDSGGCPRPGIDPPGILDMGIKAD